MVLEGKYTEKDFGEIERMFLDHLVRVSKSDRFKGEVTIDDFKKKMKKWRESTSTSPSGRHLGH